MTKQKAETKEDQEKQLAEKLEQFTIENKIKLNAGMSFPIYNKFPVELELALTIIKKHEPQFDISVVLED